MLVTWQARIWIVAVVLFLGSAYYSASEFLYLVEGRDGTAQIDEAYKVRNRGRFGRNRGQVLLVNYSFKDADGNARKGSVRQNDDWPVPPDRKIAIRYRPGIDGSSRLAGQVAWVGLFIFFACSAILAFISYRLWKEARDAYARPVRRSRR